MVLFPLPFSVPAWLYAIGFMAGSFFALKTGRDNVGHDAHLGGAIVGFLIAAGLEPEAVRYNLRIFLIVLGLSIGLLLYLWFNPLFLPAISPFLRGGLRLNRRHVGAAKHRWQEIQVDEVLDKVAKGGMESLSPDEKKVLAETSEKYQRRADSKAPESDLIL